MRSRVKIPVWEPTMLLAPSLLKATNLHNCKSYNRNWDITQLKIKWNFLNHHPTVVVLKNNFRQTFVYNCCKHDKMSSGTDICRFINHNAKEWKFQILQIIFFWIITKMHLIKSLQVFSSWIAFNFWEALIFALSWCRDSFFWSRLTLYQLLHASSPPIIWET